MLALQARMIWRRAMGTAPDPGRIVQELVALSDLKLSQIKEESPKLRTHLHHSASRAKCDVLLASLPEHSPRCTHPVPDRPVTQAERPRSKVLSSQLSETDTGCLATWSIPPRVLSLGYSYPTESPLPDPYCSCLKTRPLQRLRGLSPA